MLFYEAKYLGVCVCGSEVVREINFLDYSRGNDELVGKNKEKFNWSQMAKSCVGLK